MGPRYRGIDHPWRNFSQCQLPVRKGRGETDGLHSSWRTPSEWIPLLQRCPDPLRSRLKSAQATEILTKMSHKKEAEKSVRCVTSLSFLFHKTRRGMANNARGLLFEKAVHSPDTSSLGVSLRGETETVHKQKIPCRKWAVDPVIRATSRCSLALKEDGLMEAKMCPDPSIQIRGPYSGQYQITALPSHLIHLLSS